jgi:hypothetical protein
MYKFILVTYSHPLFVCHYLMPTLRFGKVWRNQNFGVLYFASYISNFVTAAIKTPYLSPCHPNNVPVGQKNARKKCLGRKKVSQKNVLIPF